jgi:hypothetical protein
MLIHFWARPAGLIFAFDKFIFAFPVKVAKGNDKPSVERTGCLQVTFLKPFIRPLGTAGL